MLETMIPACRNRPRRRVVAALRRHRLSLQARGRPARRRGRLQPDDLWLIDAKIQIGDLGSARELFRAYVDLAGPTGLIAEEVDPATGRALGNHPQAYSHLGLISNA